jgi:putative addiction module component (TIGR02574 family)
LEILSIFDTFRKKYKLRGVEMSNLLKKIQNDVLALSGQERAFLADRLLSSLGDDVLTDVDAAWIEEAERRYQEYKCGKRRGASAEDVFAEADLLLK